MWSWSKPSRSACAQAECDGLTRRQALGLADDSMSNPCSRQGRTKPESPTVRKKPRHGRAGREADAHLVDLYVRHVSLRARLQNDLKGAAS